MINNIINVNASNEYSFHVDQLLEKSKQYILDWFEESSTNIIVNAYIYKDQNSLREGLKKRGLGEYPEYMVACMVDEDKEKNIARSVNYYEPPLKPDAKPYSRKEYDQVIFHELIHYITDDLYGKLPEWLTEGIAKQLDGGYQDDTSNLMQNHINTYQIPDLNNMQNMDFVKKDEFGTCIYDGYDLGYIIVRYCIEVNGKSYLFNLMKNKKELMNVQQDLLNEAILYFNEKINKNAKKH